MAAVGGNQIHEEIDSERWQVMMDSKEETAKRFWEDWLRILMLERC